MDAQEEQENNLKELLGFDPNDSSGYSGSMSIYQEES